MSDDLVVADPGQRLRWAQDAVMLAWRIVDGIALPDMPDMLPGEPAAALALLIEELSGIDIQLSDLIQMWRDQ